MKHTRFGRRRRWKVATRDAARSAAGRPALRPWQRFLIGPVAVAIDAIGSFFAWVRDILRLRPRRILPPLGPGEFLVIGHRGSPTNAVENTIPSFEVTLHEGGNAIETDVVVTADRRAVLHHDWDPGSSIAFAREAGAEFDVAFRPVFPPQGSPYRRPVCELTLHDLRDRWGFARIDDETTAGATIPTIEELLVWARTKPTLRLVILDLKVPDEQDELVEVILDEVEGARKKSPFTFDVLYMTTQPKVLARIKARAATASRTLDVEIAPGLGLGADEGSCVAPALAHGNDHASIGRPRATFGGWGIYRKILGKDLRTIAARGTQGPVRRLLCWTINRPREMRDLVTMGVHGILTDRPKLLVEQAERLLGKARAKGARRQGR
jgi:glycerophosphoryl diester phosphodiesterase